MHRPSHIGTMKRFLIMIIPPIIVGRPTTASLEYLPTPDVKPANYYTDFPPDVRDD
jgi:hypothetical protein